MSGRPRGGHGPGGEAEEARANGEAAADMMNTNTSAEMQDEVGANAEAGEDTTTGTSQTSEAEAGMGPIVAMGRDMGNFAEAGEAAVDIVEAHGDSTTDAEGRGGISAGSGTTTCRNRRSKKLFSTRTG